jgi:ABC-type multidrug transport system fused ATPase/permease subunit
MSLIRGLHDADRVTVLCDGAPLPHGLKDVGSTVTLIPQEPEIFENTIEYNITLDTDQEASELMEDVELSRFASVVQRLAQGLQTNTAEKGVNLSGGEKQRLALARGFFAAKQSSVILLDEPTSSVDPVNERHIYENMFKRFADRCIVSSIHKQYLLPMFDFIYVFKDGRIVDEGTPEKLLGPGGSLHDLWEKEKRMANENK